MRGNNVPAVVEAYPRLRLTPEFAGCVIAIEQSVRSREVAPIRRDPRALEFPRQAERRPGAAKFTNLVHAVKVFADAIAQRPRIVAKQRLKRCDVVGDESGLV